MSLFNQCVGCRKRKLFVRKRSYILPQISKEPMESVGTLCGKCFKTIKNATL